MDTDILALIVGSAAGLVPLQSVPETAPPATGLLPAMLTDRGNAKLFADLYNIVDRISKEREVKARTKYRL